jgi:CopG family transcriptional regulator / antitoxin EndoAI
MRIAKTVSITLPPDLLLKAQEIAQREHRTMSELMREALRTYMSERQARTQQSWQELLQYGQARAKELGITTEEDVDRLIHEYRREKREKLA